jgi:hypothetical protein
MLESDFTLICYQNEQSDTFMYLKPIYSRILIYKV